MLQTHYTLAWSLLDTATNWQTPFFCLTSYHRSVKYVCSYPQNSRQYYRTDLSLLCFHCIHLECIDSPCVCSVFFKHSNFFLGLHKFWIHHWFHIWYITATKRIHVCTLRALFLPVVAVLHGAFNVFLSFAALLAFLKLSSKLAFGIHERNWKAMDSFFKYLFLFKPCPIFGNFQNKVLNFSRPFICCIYLAFFCLCYILFFRFNSQSDLAISKSGTLLNCITFFFFVLLLVMRQTLSEDGRQKISLVLKKYTTCVTNV